MPPESAAVRRAEALALHKSGKLAEARAAYHDLLTAFPHDGEGWHYLAVLSGQSGQDDEVLTHSWRALQCGYETASVHANIARALAARDDPMEAGAAAAHALRLAPDNVELLRDLAPLLREGGRERELLKALQRHCETLASDDQFWTDVGELAAELGMRDVAIPAFRRAASLSPLDPRLWFNLASILTMAGESGDAEAAARHGLEVDPDFDPLLFLMTQLRALASDDPIARHIAHREAADGEMGPPYLNFAKAKLHHDHGQREDAFREYRKGNEAVRARSSYDPQRAEAEIQRLTRMVADGAFERIAFPPDEDGPTPIFIVGLPRSGSTLLERMLSGCSRIAAGGEIVWLQRLIRSALRRQHLRFPEGLPDLHEASLAQIRSEYLRILRDRAAGASHVIDKLPANLLSVPLVTRLFPAARIVISVRDPVETCWSCYKHLFAGPQLFAYDLGDLAGYHNACSDLTAACAARFPQVRIARHEEILSEPRAQIERLLTFCGLEWEDGCLDVRPDSHLIRTASALQVREPLRTPASDAVSDAVSYGQWLKPLTDRLMR